jgi:hypothetical protein
MKSSISLFICFIIICGNLVAKEQPFQKEIKILNQNFRKKGLTIKDIEFDEENYLYTINIVGLEGLAGRTDSKNSLYFTFEKFLEHINKITYPNTITSNNIKVIIWFYTQSPPNLCKCVLENDKVQYFQGTHENPKLIGTEDWEEIVKELSKPKPPNPDLRLVKKVENELEKELYTLYGLYISATGGSWLENRKYFTIHFHLDKKYNIEKARPILIDVTNKFLTKLNQHDQLKKALEHEFTIHNINIALLFDDSDSFDPNSHIVVARIGPRNLIKYKTMSSNNKRLELVKEETYEEALQILNQNNNEK